MLAIGRDDLAQRDPLGKPRQRLHLAGPGLGGDHRADLTGRDPLAVRSGDLRDTDQQFVAGPGHAEAGPVQGLAGGAAMFHAGAHLGLVGIAQSQLDPGVRHVQQRLLLAHQPSAGAGHHVHAVGKPLSRNGDSPIAQAAVFVVEIAEVVDDEEHVAELVVGIGAAAAAGPNRRSRNSEISIW